MPRAHSAPPGIGREGSQRTEVLPSRSCAQRPRLPHGWVEAHIQPAARLNARQRRALTPPLGRRDPRTAVLSDALVVHGLVTAVSWLGIPNSAFGCEHHEAAAGYLARTADELALATAHLAALRSEAGVHEQPWMSS